MRYDAVISSWLKCRPAFPGNSATLAAARRNHDRPGKGRPAIRVAPRSCLLTEQVNDMAFSRDVGSLPPNAASCVLRIEGYVVTPAARTSAHSPGTKRPRFLNGANLWVVSLRGMVFSHDAGKNWSWHDLPEFRARNGWLWLQDSAPGAEQETLVAGAENGLYISRDGGKAWIRSAPACRKLRSRISRSPEKHFWPPCTHGGFIFRETAAAPGSV